MNSSQKQNQYDKHLEEILMNQAEGLGDEHRTYLNKHSQIELNEALDHLEEKHGKEPKYSRLVHRKKSVLINYVLCKNWFEQFMVFFRQKSLTKKYEEPITNNNTVFNPKASVQVLTICDKESEIDDGSSNHLTFDDLQTYEIPQDYSLFIPNSPIYEETEEEIVNFYKNIPY